MIFCLYRPIFYHPLSQYEPIIQPGSENLLHHLVLHYCTGTAGDSDYFPSSFNCYQNVPSAARNCRSSALLGWAVGGKVSLFYFISFPSILFLNYLFTCFYFILPCFQSTNLEVFTLFSFFPSLSRIQSFFSLLAAFNWIIRLNPKNQSIRKAANNKTFYY